MKVKNKRYSPLFQPIRGIIQDILLLMCTEIPHHRTHLRRKWHLVAKDSRWAWRGLGSQNERVGEGNRTVQNVTAVKTFYVISGINEMFSYLNEKLIWIFWAFLGLESLRRTCNSWNEPAILTTYRVFWTSKCARKQDTDFFPSSIFLWGIFDCFHWGMFKRRDYVELYEKDLAKWALLRNVNTVVKQSTLLPVKFLCVCVYIQTGFLC